ncbi:hypothetical protein J2W88_003971 [Acidovorax delafieldii]|uniref:Uncharacterized protein n=1 Tax=Acidovorax delafieldii TaxID=47920 RepID=A0AAJ2BU56_ACIDE|nr:hypothetical protein [Acidovorax delafieldii]MDR6768667.1 hypothetical protein [Acidovorax delafieldii]MDR6837383.1 hypothetical protein [Acidovorax delafieldii]MDR7366873.1 hypothetical protein [Acidovorax delafieldii]
MNFLNRLFRAKTEYVYGTAGKMPKPARRHSSGRVECVLWKAGEKGHTSDYWYPIHEDWWHTFKEDPMTKNAELIRSLRQVCLRTKGKSMDEVLQDFIGTMEEAADAMEAQAREIEGLRKDADRYAVVRRGQHWSVIDGIGDPLTGDALDAGVDAVIAAKGAVK